MATKKQKREKALAKREAFLAEVRQAGLDAQKADREERERSSNRMAELAKEQEKRLEGIYARNPHLKPGAKTESKPKPKAPRRPRGIAPQVIFTDKTS